MLIFVRYSDYKYTMNEPSRDLYQVAISSAPVLYDFSGLGRLAQDACFVREMQRMFVEYVPKQLMQLATTVEEEQWESTAGLAHSLKATFGTLRIEPSTSLLKELETSAKQQREKQELKTTLEIITSTANAIVLIFRDELSRAA